MSESWNESYHNLHNVFISGRRFQLPKRQIINVMDDEYVYLLLDGYVKRCLITREGDYAIQSIYGRGQVFPLSSIMRKLFDEDIANGNRAYYYQTITSVTIQRAPLSAISDALAADPGLYQGLLYETARRLQSNIQQLDNHSLKHVRWRLAHLLVYFAESFGRPMGDGYLVSPTLTHGDIAGMLNVSRETISRSMTYFLKHGYIESEGHYFFVPSTQALKALYA